MMNARFEGLHWRYLGRLGWADFGGIKVYCSDLALIQPTRSRTPMSSCFRQNAIDAND